MSCARTPAMALCLWAAVHSAALGSCSPDSFGKLKADLCSSNECRSPNEPKEIVDIARGVYSEYIGLFVNDGYAQWTGLDLEHSTLSDIRRFAGRRFSPAAEELKQLKRSATNYGREIRTSSLQAIELVRAKKLSRSAIADVICIANGLWTTLPDPRLGPPFVPMSDSHNKLYLLDRGEIKAFGGPGELTEAPLKLRELIEGLLRKQIQLCHDIIIGEST
jgi:hypothetical protein